MQSLSLLCAQPLGLTDAGDMSAGDLRSVGLGNQHLAVGSVGTTSFEPSQNPPCSTESLVKKELCLSLIGSAQVAASRSWGPQRVSPKHSNGVFKFETRVRRD